MKHINKLKLTFALSLLIACTVSTITATKVMAAPTDPQQSSSVGIDGTVRGDPPKTAATITFPTNGQSVNTLPVRVSGLCTGNLLVKIFKNGVFAGSAQCTNGSYSVQVDLFNGVNELVARVYDALDQQGPDSNVVTVTFTQTGFNTSAPRVALTSNYARRGANPGDTLSWPIVLSGGTGPYAVSVSWGDGETELISRTFPGEFTITHKYKSPGVYPILIKVTDGDSNSAYLQLVGVGNGALAQDNQGNIDNAVIQTRVIWWPLVVALVFIVVSFWLGGRFKLEQLRRQAEKRVSY